MATLNNFLINVRKKEQKRQQRRRPVSDEIYQNPIMIFKYSSDYLVYQLGFKPEWCCMMAERALSGGIEEAIHTIQKHWLECYYNPKYKICRKRISRNNPEHQLPTN